MLEVGMGLALMLAIYSWFTGLSDIKNTHNIEKLRSATLTYHHVMITICILTILNILFR